MNVEAKIAILVMAGTGLLVIPPRVRLSFHRLVYHSPLCHKKVVTIWSQ